MNSECSIFCARVLLLLTSFAVAGAEVAEHKRSIADKSCCGNL
jgi:hypothetical protein